MYSETLQELGLAKNESFIYVTLVKGGGMGVSKIALKSGVHRRNVYDSMQRLLEKGLVYEEIGDRENLYFAVDPTKLIEIIEEKRSKVELLLPELIKAFHGSSSEQSVSVFRGLDAAKNCLLHMEREGKEIFLYGANGGSLSPKLNHVFSRLKKDLQQKKIPVNVLYRREAYKEDKTIVGHFGTTSKCRILPKEYEDRSSFNVFGEYVYFQSGQYSARAFDEKSELTFFVIKSKGIAEMMKNLFYIAWEASIIPSKVH